MKCKGYMNRYVQLVEARLLLVLQPTLSKTVTQEQLLAVGQSGLGCVLQMFKLLEKMKRKYANNVFPAESFAELTDAIVSTSEVLSAVVNAGVTKMDQWWLDKR